MKDDSLSVKRPVLLLDMDEVLCQFWAPIVSACGRELRDITTWETPAWARQAFNDAMTYAHYIGLEEMPGAIECVKELSEKWDIYVVTHTPASKFNQNLLQAKRQWLANHGLMALIKGFFATEHKHLVMGDVLVDDRVENCEKFAATGRQAILFRRPWSDVTDRVDFWNADGWGDVCDLLEVLYNTITLEKEAEPSPEVRPDFTQIDPEFLELMALVGTYGRQKYPHGSRHDTPEEKNLASLLRHVNELQRGEVINTRDWDLPVEAHIAYRAQMSWEIRTHKERLDMMLPPPKDEDDGKHPFSSPMRGFFSDDRTRVEEDKEYDYDHDDLCVVCKEHHKNEVCW